jgi:adenosylcobinamide-GDP ribazoletransferase
LGVGLVGGLVDQVAIWVGCGATVAAIWSVASQLLLTGALHEDGLADTVDGFGAGGDRARKLAIMRDSRIGAFGALALILALGLRVAVIADRPGWPATWALMAAGASGRAGLVGLLWLLHPARADGLAVELHRPPLWALACAGAVALFADGTRVFAAAVVATLAAAWLAQRQVGGYSGDILGASEQAVEAVVLSAFD